MTGDALIVRTLFAELGGYCVLDVSGMQGCWVPPNAKPPIDLLGHLSDAEQVQRIAACEALVPIVVDEPDEYRIAIYHDEGQPPGFDSLLGDEAGWRFRAGPDGQQLLGIGHLKAWSPRAPAIVGFQLPLGEHSFRCRWGLRGGQRCIDLLFATRPPSSELPTGREFPVEVAFLASR